MFSSMGAGFRLGLLVVAEFVFFCRGGRTVQAAACRAAVYGFNSHPRLSGLTSIHLGELALLFAFLKCSAS